MNRPNGGRGGRVLRWLLPSMPVILGLVALGNALFLRGPGMFAADGDGARHLRLGHEIIERGAVPETDSFSHTRTGDPIVLHEWGSEVVLALADSTAGMPGVAVLAALLYLVAVLGVFRTGLELGATRPTALVVGVLALLLQSIHLLPRPHLFTTAMAAVFMVLLVRFARTGSNRPLLVLPPLMLVWANLHGGFLLGFILLGAFLIGAFLKSAEFQAGRQAVRPLLAVLAACLVVSMLTPAGPVGWLYTVGHLSGDDFLLAVTNEFQSIDFHQGFGRLFLVALFAGPALWMTGRVRVSWLGAGLYLFFAASALYSVRNIPLFTLASLPWVAVWTEAALRKGGAREAMLLARLRRMDEADRTLGPHLWVGAGIVMLAIALGPAQSLYRFDAEKFPVAAAAQLHGAEIEGNVFNQLHWGGYLLYERPDIPVFIDGQTDFYGEALALEYLTTITAGPGWREVLDEYDVEWTMTGRAEPINQVLALDPGWVKTYEDDVAVVFRRRTSLDADTSRGRP